MSAGVDPVTVGVMGDNSDNDGLVDELATVYAVAIRLHRRGASDAEIAIALGTEASAVPLLVEVGERKLDELRRRPR